jgi:hypothetical protein
MQNIKKTIFLLLFLTLPLFSQGSISGLMFGDFYYVISHHDSLVEGKNGFWFRRIYFTYDYKFTENVFTRLRFEMNSPGDFKTSGILTPYVKDAYIGAKFGKNTGYFGISPTPTWEFIENFWGYRAVEKTPGDLYKAGSSRDFGIALKGEILPFISYHFLFGNGEGIKSEINTYKKEYLSILFKKEPIFLEIYADYADGKKKEDTKVYQVFLGLKLEKIIFGFQYYNYDKGQGEGKDRIKIDVFSSFVNLNVSEKITFLLRVDRMADPNPFIKNVDYIPFSEKNPFYFGLIGVDFKPLKGISIIPNFEFVIYEKYKENEAPKNTLIGKLTFSYNWR